MVIIMKNNYKTKLLFYKNNKEKQKNDLENEYGYNIESIKRNVFSEDYSKEYVFKDKDYNYYSVNNQL